MRGGWLRRAGHGEKGGSMVSDRGFLGASRKLKEAHVFRWVECGANVGLGSSGVSCEAKMLLCGVRLVEGWRVLFHVWSSPCVRLQQGSIRITAGRLQFVARQDTTPLPRTADLGPALGPLSLQLPFVSRTGAGEMEGVGREVDIRDLHPNSDNPNPQSPIPLSTSGGASSRLKPAWWLLLHYFNPTMSNYQQPRLHNPIPTYKSRLQRSARADVALETPGHRQ